MNKDDTQNDSDLNVLKKMATILSKHGKTDDEIKEILEYHFPVSSTIMHKIIETRKKHVK